MKYLNRSTVILFTIIAICEKFNFVQSFSTHHTRILLITSHPLISSRRHRPPFQLGYLKARRNTYDEISSLALQEIPDFLITDSLDIEDEKRPSLIQALLNPRDVLASALMIVGTIVSIFNIIGRYDNTYQLLEMTAIVIGILSSIAHLVQIQTGYLISNNIRRGIVDDAAVNLYASLYTCAVSWLALRTSPFCPKFLSIKGYDVVLSSFSIIIFLYSLLGPIVTLLAEKKSGDVKGNIPYQITQTIVSSVRKDEQSKLWSQNIELPILSETELLRARGLVFIGLLGCVFAPDALSFCLGGQEWWGRVSTMHPSQQILESSTSLFALFATEASMIAHRVGKLGVADFKTIVPVFSGVCFILAVIPCVCSLHWLGDDVSFFSFYTE